MREGGETAHERVGERGCGNARDTVLSATGKAREAREEAAVVVVERRASEERSSRWAHLVVYYGKITHISIQALDTHRHARQGF